MEHIPTDQGSGRFDIPAGSLYLAETADHAVAEKIGRYRGRTIGPRHLLEFGLPHAMVGVTILNGIAERIADLCDPRILLHYDVLPDRTAYRDISTTQEIARRLHEAGAAGLRWWSSFFGEWHTVVLFADRFRTRDLQYGRPVILGIEDPIVVRAAEAIGVEIGR